MIATVVIIVITLLNVIVFKLRQIQEANLAQEFNISQSDQSCRGFSLAEIQSATYNFDDALVLGKGGFGKVYKGVIDNGATTVAIKRLNPLSKQGAPEFWREIEMLSKIRHSHIVSLIGYCNQRNEMILVYEYMVRGTIADHLHKNGRNGGDNSTLSWVERLKICIGAARGLDYLHTGMGVKERVIHRDVKSSNILLDENWAAKISDFGLSKIGPANQSTTHVSTNVKGTIGYLDMEYFLTHRLTRKSDVYAFGVVLFEVLCGRPAVDFRLDVEQCGLAGWAHQCIKKGKLYQIIDPELSGQILPDSLAVFEQIADQCLHKFSKKRPTMAEVVVSLERALALQERIDSSMLEGEIFDIGGAFFNQENADSYMEQNEVINADSFIEQQEVINASNDLHEELIDGIGRLGDASNEQKQIDENADSPREQPKVIINAGNGVEQIDRIMLLGDANNSQSHVNPAKTMAFTRKLRLFFFGKARGTSGKLEKGEMSQSEDVIIPGKLDKGEMPISQTQDTRNGLVFFEGKDEYDLEDLLRASAEVLGKGTFGTSYMVKLESGTAVVVQRLKDVSVGKTEFVQVMEVVGSIKHQNVVELRAYYWSRDEKFNVYDYYSQGSIDAMLHGRRGEYKIPLSWETRLRIAIGAARGIARIHAENGGKLVHGNIKSSNIFLNSQLYGCVSHIALSSITAPLRLSIALGANYQAPEVMNTQKVSQPSDVYSFGVLLLELLTGKSPVREDLNLVRWVQSVVREEWTAEVFDLELMRYPNIEQETVMMLQIAMECAVSVPDQRPKMVDVIKMIENVRPDGF